MALSKKIKELIPYYSYNIHYSDEDKAYVVSVDELTGCMTHGDSAAEALELAHEAVALVTSATQACGRKPLAGWSANNYARRRGIECGGQILLEDVFP